MEGGLPDAGFLGRLALTGGNVRYHVGNLLVRLGEELAEQIYHCLCFARQSARCEEAACRKQAAALARKFLRRIPAIRVMLAADAQAAWRREFWLATFEREEAS